MIRARVLSAICEGTLAFFLAASLRSEKPPAPAISLPQAISLYQKHDFRRACPALASIASAQPASALPHLYLLGCAIHERAGARVHSEREKLHLLVPRGARAYTLAGGWLARAGYCLEAQEEFTRATPPREAGTFEFALAQCHQDRGEVAPSIRQYRKAVELNPDKEEYPPRRLPTSDRTPHRAP